MERSPAVLEPGGVFVARVAAFLPSLLAALLVFLVGWPLAKAVQHHHPRRDVPWQTARFS
ncbi:MAG: hypothetical protein HYS36_06640 [Candidatus Rokubacteria bacterium]|nr:hypothetical protein [Candidatus Rokubacteria bacterium]